MREFLWGIGRKWIEFGIDGWRLDVPNEIDDDAFWREFRRRVRPVNPEAYIVGEVWTDAARWLKGDMWDAVMNYQFTRACIAFFIGERSRRGRPAQDEPVSRSDRRAARRSASQSSGCSDSIIPNVSAVMLNLLGSHDMARFVTLARGDKSALELATLFQMTYPARRRSTTATRSAWPAATIRPTAVLSPGTSPRPGTRDLLHEFQRLIALRRDRPALRRGIVPLPARGRRSLRLCPPARRRDRDRRPQRRPLQRRIELNVTGLVWRRHRAGAGLVRPGRPGGRRQVAHRARRASA